MARRKVAAELANKLAAIGLVKLPALLSAYATGNYKEFLHMLDREFHFLTTDPDAVVKEVRAVLGRMATDPEGRQEIDAVLEAVDAMKAKPVA